MIREVIDSSVRFGRQLDSDHVPLQHFFIVLEHVLRHGLKPKKVILCQLNCSHSTVVPAEVDKRSLSRPVSHTRTAGQELSSSSQKITIDWSDNDDCDNEIPKYTINWNENDDRDNERPAPHLVDFPNWDFWNLGLLLGILGR